MKSLRDIFIGIFFAGAASLVLIGAFSLALSEGISTSQKNSNIAEIISTPIPDLFISLPSQPAPTQTSSPSIAPERTTYFPTFTTNTSTVINDECRSPSGWIEYRVQSKDNLFRISLAYRVSIEKLQAANCMGNSILLITGQTIYVPNVITSTPLPSLTFTVTPTIKQKTSTPVPSKTLSPTLTATYTPLASLTPTSTITPSLTYTMALTNTQTETQTQTETDTPTPLPFTSTPIPDKQ